jgi:hypothetical protein
MYVVQMSCSAAECVYMAVEWLTQVQYQVVRIVDAAMYNISIYILTRLRYPKRRVHYYFAHTFTDAAVLLCPQGEADEVHA